PSYVAGVVGQAISLDGTNDYVELPIGSVIANSTSMSISLWVNWAAAGGGWQRIFDFGTGTSVNMFLTPSASGGTTGVMRFAITTTGSAGESRLNASQTLPTGWHHVAVVIDGLNKQMWLYLDGELLASGPTNVIPKDLGVTTQNWLGRSQYAADAYLTGQIDELKIYDRVLSPAEVRYLAGDKP
ncbi:MAG: LamG domain-containing protein, partial [Sedimentisphaerales bacterium]|nr:LamG domain-containing protein [Sedimentisphaerales bacterium]